MTWFGPAATIVVCVLVCLVAYILERAERRGVVGLTPPTWADPSEEDLYEDCPWCDDSSGVIKIGYHQPVPGRWIADTEPCPECEGSGTLPAPTEQKETRP